MTQITKENLTFLEQLSKNNNRDWFTLNKDVYEKNHQNIIAFADDLLFLMNQHDTIETVSGKKSLYRIYRDVRFSSDKSPYKNHWSGGFRRATKALRGGYYFHIEPGNTFVGGGFWGPNKDDLQHIRENIALDSTELQSILKSSAFKSTFGTLQGEQLKTAPKGFDKNQEGVELLRFKQFIITRSFSDAEVLKEDFVVALNETFQQMRPFLDYMSEILTTDLNGVPLI